MSFKVDISDALKGLAETEIKMRAAVRLYGDTAAKKLEAEAKKNKPWEDRTGNAKNTIKGVSGWDGFSTNISVAKADNSDKLKVNSVDNKEGGGQQMVIAVTGNMDYSPHLEFCNEKKNAVLYPTVKKMSPEILKGMANLLNK